MKSKRVFATPALAALSLGAICFFCPLSLPVRAQDAPAAVPQPPPILILNGKPFVGDNISDIAAAKISLSVENGDRDDFVKAIGGSTTKLLSIETRGGTPFRASLKVSNMPIEDVLRGLAGFSHCNLYLLPGRFLMSPERLLRPAEKAQLIQDPALPLVPTQE